MTRVESDIAVIKSPIFMEILSCLFKKMQFFQLIDGNHSEISLDSSLK